MRRFSEAEGLKQAQVLEAEGPSRGGVPGRRGARASGRAEQRATQVVSEAIAKGDVQAINYIRRAENTREALARSPVRRMRNWCMMPLEASSLIGSLGGIGAIARDVFGEASEPPPRTARVPRTVRREADMIARVIGELGPWNWMVLGFVLLALEVLVPASSALDSDRRHPHRCAVAPALGLGDLVVAGPGPHFLGLSLLSAYGGSRIMRDRQGASDQPLLNRRGEQLVGRTAISPSRSRKAGAGSVWATRSGALQGRTWPVGSRVRVTVSRMANCA